MRFFQWALVLFLFTCGCATEGTTQRERIQPVYRQKIEEWQMKIRSEGWSDSQVHSILKHFRGLATYRMEIQDHWDTPKEFIQKGFTGDCEDITAYMMGTLKRLGYPYPIRILIVRNLFEDHALLLLQMPEGRWEVYDVVRRDVPSLQIKLLKPIVAFDEKRTYWFATQVPLRDSRCLGSPNVGQN